MSKKIVIEPVTRVEGHGKVTINLDDEGNVANSHFHIVEFRGFEKFIQGHPYWEVPMVVQRLCGICPVSHHLAASKAIDQIVGLDPEELSPTASKLRSTLLPFQSSGIVNSRLYHNLSSGSKGFFTPESALSMAKGTRIFPSKIEGSEASNEVIA